MTVFQILLQKYFFITKKRDLTKIVGVIELNGLFPGFIKFVGEGGKSKAFVMFGELKSSISLLNIIPLDFDRINAPKL